MSGGAAAADAGKVTLMIGGSRDAVNACAPVFELFAGHRTHVGGIGAGHTIKLVFGARRACTWYEAQLNASATNQAFKLSLIGAVRQRAGPRSVEPYQTDSPPECSDHVAIDYADLV